MTSRRKKWDGPAEVRGDRATALANPAGADSTSSKRARVVSLRGLMMAAGAAALAIVLFLFFGPWSSRTFERETWIAEGRIPCGQRHHENTQRHTMVDDLIERHRIVGMPVDR